MESPTPAKGVRVLVSHSRLQNNRLGNGNRNGLFYAVSDARRIVGHGVQKIIKGIKK